MLLLIALANAAGVVFAGTVVYDPDPHGLDRVVALLMGTLVDARAYPVFAMMFGYGLVQLVRRRTAAGATPAAARSMLLRRNAWLVVFGFVHAALLYSGDFLGAYGIVGIAVTVLLLGRGDRVHRLVLWLWALSAVQVLVVGALALRGILGGPNGPAALPDGHVASLAATDYVAGLLDRLGEWPVHTATVLPFVMIVWLGTWAARRQVLENPAAHRRLLRRTAVGGLGIAVAGGLPSALVSAGLLAVDPSNLSLVSMLHGGSGMFAGPGYVALFGLLAMHLSTRAPGTVVQALSALGRRSLSGYLFQSVAWLVLLAPYTLSLGTRFASPTLTAVVVAALVWLATVVLAHQLERRGRSGPAEVVLRRLAYGPRNPR